VAAVAPTAIELESVAVIIDEGEPQTFVFADGPVPTAVWIGLSIGKSTDPREMLITNADDILVEVVKWIAQGPHEFAATFSLSIAGRRDWIVRIFEPPEGI